MEIVQELDISSRYAIAKIENAHRNRIKEVLRATECKWDMFGGLVSIRLKREFFNRPDVKRQVMAASLTANQLNNRR